MTRDQSLEIFGGPDGRNKAGLNEYPDMKKQKEKIESFQIYLHEGVC